MRMSIGYLEPLVNIKSAANVRAVSLPLIVDVKRENCNRFIGVSL